MDNRDIHYLCWKYHLHEHIGVLCGWDWVMEHKDIVPPNKIEISVIKMEVNHGESKNLSEVPH